MRTIFCLLIFVLGVCCCRPASAATAEVCGDPLLTIPDGGAPDLLAVDTLTLDGDLSIGEVKVAVEITHTWIGDLAIAVASPAGTIVYLYDGAGEDEDDIDVIFSDTGAAYDGTSWICGCEVMPSGPGTLSDFAGEQSAGDWTLAVGDTVPEDGGSLDHWCVTVTGCSPPPEIDLTCYVGGSRTTLLWSTPTLLYPVDVYRDGELIYSLDALYNGGLFDVDVTAGLYIYTLVSNEDGRSRILASCTSQIGAVVEGCAAGSDIISYFEDPVISTVEILDDVAPTEIAVSVDISHTWDGDLAITVESPDAVSVALFDKDFGSPSTDQHDMVLTYIDGGAPHASVPLTCGCYMEPAQTDGMSELLGKSAAGTWTLTVADTFEDDDGVLNGWCVDIHHEYVFLRGDVDGNGHFSGVSDAIYLLRYAFTGGTAPPCFEAADVNGDGFITGLTDALRLLNHAFLGGPPPAAPYPDCGAQEMIKIGCAFEPDCS